MDYLKLKLFQNLEKLFKKLREEAEEAGVELRDYLLETEIPFVSEVPSILGLDDILPKTLGDLINLDIYTSQFICIFLITSTMPRKIQI